MPIANLPISNLFLGAFVMVPMMSMVHRGQLLPTQGVEKDAMLLDRFFLFHPILILIVVLGCKAQNGTHFGFVFKVPIKATLSMFKLQNEFFFST